MDHKRRERVVTRLAQEASERRVIVFTHDLYFLNLLIEEAEKNGVPVEEQSLTRRQEGFGAPDPGLPFDGMSTTKRVGYLHNKHQHIKKVYESGDELEHLKLTVSAYQKLRNAQEHAIEEVLLLTCLLTRTIHAKPDLTKSFILSS